MDAEGRATQGAVAEDAKAEFYGVVLARIAILFLATGIAKRAMDVQKQFYLGVIPTDTVSVF